MIKEKYVEIFGVHQVFGEGPSRYHALADVALNVAQGEFVTLIGHSGCGKSTLLNLVAGFLRPTLGSVIVAGREVEGPALNRAVVFQSHSLLPWLTVEQNVRLAVDAVHPGRDSSFRKAETMKYVRMVKLEAHTRKKPGELSGGMKQRVGIARAFATDPGLMLLDEPFGALDALTRGEMQDELLSLWERNRKTVLMITHDVDEAVFLSDRVVLMSNGPRAGVARIVDVDIPRPRTREKVIAHPKYDGIRKEILQYLIRQSKADAA